MRRTVVQFPGPALRCSDDFGWSLEWRLRHQRADEGRSLVMGQRGGEGPFDVMQTGERVLVRCQATCQATCCRAWLLAPLTMKRMNRSIDGLTTSGAPDRGSEAELLRHLTSDCSNHGNHD